MSKVTDFIVNESIVGSPAVSAPTGFLRKVLVVSPTLDNENTFFTINDPTEIATYTDDPTLIQFFKGGLSSIDVVGMRSNGTVDLARVNLEDYYTLVFSPMVDAKELLPSFEGYDGKVYVSIGTITDGTYAGKDYCVAVDPSSDGWIHYVVGKLLSSTKWLNHQLIPVDIAKENVMGQKALWDTARRDNLSFLITDDYFNVMLGFFVFGDGTAIADAYLEKQMRVELQTELLNYLRTQNPTYKDLYLRGTQNVIKNVLDYYVENSMITSYSNLKVPMRAEQSTDDIANHLVNNIEFIFSNLGAIWSFNLTERRA